LRGSSRTSGWEARLQTSVYTLGTYHTHRLKRKSRRQAPFSRTGPSRTLMLLISTGWTPGPPWNAPPRELALPPECSFTRNTGNMRRGRETTAADRQQRNFNQSPPTDTAAFTGARTAGAGPTTLRARTPSPFGSTTALLPALRAANTLERVTAPCPRSTHTAPQQGGRFSARNSAHGR